MRLYRSWQYLGYIVLFCFSLNLIFLGFYNPEMIRGVWSPLTLWILALSIGLWGRFLYQTLYAGRNKLLKYWKNYGLGLLIAILLTVVIANSVESGYRVLSDETNLIAVSKAIALQGEIDNVTLGKWYYNQFHSLSHELPKRPALFPFLVAILHKVLGYSPSNAFVLNLIVLCLLLWMVYVIFSSLIDPQAGLAGVFLTLAQPLVMLCATCAGFDLLAVTALLVTLVVFYLLMSYPTHDLLKLVWMSTILMAYTRYEYILLSGLIHGLVIIWKQVRWKSAQHPLGFYSLTPLFYTPLLWQQFLAQGSYTEGSDHLFRLGNFLPHWQELIQAQLSIQGSIPLPYLSWVNGIGGLSFCVGIIGVVVGSGVGFKLLGAKNNGHLVAVLSLLSMVVILLTGLYLTHYFGHYTHPASARFFLLLTIFLSVMPLFLMAFIKFPSTLILMYATVSFLVGHSLAMENLFFTTLNEPRKDVYVQEFLGEQPSKNFLLITSRPGQYTIYDYGAVDFSYANAHWQELETELSQYLYEKIFVVQDFEYTTQAPIALDVLNPKFQLIPLVQRQLTAQGYVQISQVQDLKP